MPIGVCNTDYGLTSPGASQRDDAAMVGIVAVLKGRSQPESVPGHDYLRSRECVIAHF